jgi:glutathione peroxidase
MNYRNLLTQLSVTLAVIGTCGITSAQKSTNATAVTPMIQEQQQKSFHDFEVKTLSGQDFNLDQLKGKRVLVVNTASECGFTPQYAQLQELYSKYADAGFVVVGFPSNDFGGQEPGSSSEIAAFCEKNYGVTFPMMAKVSVKGDQISPVYAWLTQKSLNGVRDTQIKWNFTKFLIDENGNFITAFSGDVEPSDSRIVLFAAGEQW